MSSSKWSTNQLPQEMWQAITSHITSSPIDACRFRAVCSSWRSLLPLSLLPPSPHPSSPPSLSPFFVCRLEHDLPLTSSACLTRAEASRESHMRLLAPLSTRSPTKPNDGAHHRPVNVLGFRLIEIYRGCCLRGPDSNGFHLIKVMSLDDNNGLGLGVLVGIFVWGELGYWRPGGNGWTIVLEDEANSTRLYDDVVLYNGHIYVTDKSGIVWWVNTSNTGLLSLVQYSPPIYLEGGKKRLVESRGQLYLVDMFFYHKKAFEVRVYMLDEEWGTWVHVSSLGNDRLFVLTEDCNFSASARGLDGCPGNCIFFTDSPYVDVDGATGYVARVFRLDDRSIRRVASEHYSQLFTPPVSLAES